VSRGIIIPLLCLSAGGCHQSPTNVPAKASNKPQPDADISALMHKADALVVKEPPLPAIHATPPPMEVIIEYSKPPARSMPAANAEAAQAHAIRPTATLQEKMRDEAVERFGARLQTLQQQAADSGAYARRYKAACAGQVTHSEPVKAAGRPVTEEERQLLVTQVVLLPGGSFGGPTESDNESTPTCRALMSDIEAASTNVTRELRNIEITATAAGIYPGIMRDLFAKYGFN
jgi:hypothetical protein